MFVHIGYLFSLISMLYFVARESEWNYRFASYWKISNIDSDKFIVNLIAD